jgi:hypothetical protein
MPSWRDMERATPDVFTDTGKLMRYRSKSTRRHSYTRTGGGYSRKSARGVTATGTPYQMTTVTPNPTETEHVSEQSPTFTMGGTPSKGGAGLVFILAFTLFVVSTWDGYGKYAFNTLLGGADFTPVIPFPMMVGGLVFVIILSAISEADDSNLALYMVIGLWLLYILFYGQKTWTNIWGWLGGTSGVGNWGNPLGPASFSTLSSLFKKTTPLPDVSGASSSNPSSNITVIGNYNTGSSQGNSGIQNATTPQGWVSL